MDILDRIANRTGKTRDFISDVLVTGAAGLGVMFVSGVIPLQAVPFLYEATLLTVGILAWKRVTR